MSTINAAKNQLAIAMNDVEDNVYQRFFGKALIKLKAKWKGSGLHDMQSREHGF
jgi:hypothetical protein